MERLFCVIVPCPVLAKPHNFIPFNSKIQVEWLEKDIHPSSPSYAEEVPTQPF
jgi:hypothetical protein